MKVEIRDDGALDVHVVVDGREVTAGLNEYVLRRRATVMGRLELHYWPEPLDFVGEADVAVLIGGMELTDEQLRAVADALGPSLARSVFPWLDGEGDG